MYLLSDLIYLIVYHLVGYRRKVSRSNLTLAFPDRSPSDIRRLEHLYYHHLADLAVEFIHNLFASPQAILRRYRIVDRRALDECYERGQTVILASAHYNNWEYMVSSLNMQLRHHGIGVGKPLSDKLTGPFIARRRVRYGTEVVYHTNVRQVVDYYHRHRVPCALMMLGDQSPSNPAKSYWTHFLHRDTAFLYGTEYFARKYGYPVFYYHVDKVRRGHYEVRFTPLCEHPTATPQYTIVELYVRMLERQIEQQPEYWLWSHRRWKHSRPTPPPTA